MSRTVVCISVSTILVLGIGLILAARGHQAEPKNRPPADWQDSLRGAAKGADKLVIVGAGIDIKGAGRIQELLDLVEIDPGQSGLHCLCDGDYLLRFYKGDLLLFTLGWHHGMALRWHGGKWSGDAHLTNKAQVAIPAWFQRNGFAALEKDRQARMVAEREERERRERFDRHFPGSVRNFSDRKEVAVAICRAFGTFKGYRQSWSSYTTDESSALSIIGELTGETFLAALEQLKDDRDGLLGAARFFFWDRFCDKIPRQAQAEWTIRLAEVALTDGWDGNKPLVLRRLSAMKQLQVEALLLDVFRGKVGKEVDFNTAWHKEPGLRAGAALGLALQGKDSIKPDVVKLLAQSTAKPDVAALEIALALLGEPKRVKKEHFQLESYSIGYAGLRAIERHKGEHGLMEILIEGAHYHPWGAVRDETVKTFQRITGLELDSEEIEAWWAIKQGRQPKTKLILHVAQPLLVFRDNVNPQRCAVFSPDGRLIVAADDDKHHVTVWNAATGQLVRKLHGHTYGVIELAFSPDGKRLVTASQDQTLKIWDTTTWEAIRTLEGHKQQIMSVAYSPDGTLFASAGHDKTVKVWDAATGNEKFTFQRHAAGVQCVAFSPDSKNVASSSHDGVVNVWEALTGKEVFALKCPQGWFNSVVFSPDGRHLAAAGGDANTVRVWDALTGKERFTCQTHSGWITSLSFSPDSKLLASASMDKTVMVWDLLAKKERATFKAHTNWVYSVAFSPDNRRLVTASADNTVKVWALAKLP